MRIGGRGPRTTLAVALLIVALTGAAYGSLRGGDSLDKRVRRLEHQVDALRERLDGDLTCITEDLTGVSEDFAAEGLGLSPDRFELVDVRCAQGYAYATVIDIPQTLQGSSLLYRYEDGRWQVIPESADTSIALCAGDWELFAVPFGTWLQLGLDELPC